jgi:hypothetical protein
VGKTPFATEFSDALRVQKAKAVDHPKFLGLSPIDRDGDSAGAHALVHLG